MMNDLLGRKILFVLAPLFLLVFTILSGGILWSVAKDMETDVEHNLRRVARINEARLNGLLGNVRVTVAGVAMAFASMDASARDARLQGDRLVIAMLDNDNIYNAWAAFEPNAFDGNDAAYRNDASGVPSGRYLRSYVRDDDSKARHATGERNEAARAPGIIERHRLLGQYEATLDDIKKSPWYVIPKESGKLYTDITTTSPYDYGIGEGNVHSVSVVAPVFRNGKVIGVIGGDLLAGQLVQDRRKAGGIASFILSPENFSVIYAPDSRMIGVSLEKHAFAHFAELKAAMQSRQELFLKNETPGPFGEASFVYLKPVYLRAFDDEIIYVSVALPTSVVSGAVREASLPIAGALLVMLLVFAAMFLFVTHYISAPIHRLCAAMDAMTADKMDILTPEQDKQDEIGVMARALRYMQQQFRMHRAIARRARQKLDLHLALNSALYKSLTFEESLKRVLRLAREFFRVDMASLMILSMEERARLFALSGKAGEFNARSLIDGPEFEAHAVLVAALQGKDYLLLKKSSVQGAPGALDLTMIAPKACAACALPIRAKGGVLRACLILEIRHSGAVVLHDDDALNFIAARLSCFFMRHETEVEKQIAAATSARAAAVSPVAQAEPLAPATPAPNLPPLVPETSDPKTTEKPADPPLLIALRRLPGLDAGHAILMMGGDVDLYVGLLPVVVREIDGALTKMEAFLAQDDVHAFAIAVHGIRGALNNVGASDLGRFAHELEMAAKALRLRECKARYPAFARKLGEFSGALAEILEGGRAAATRGTLKTEGDLEALRVDLERIRAALETYDLTEASKRLEYAWQFSYARKGQPDDKEMIDAQLSRVKRLLESVEYEEASAAVEQLLARLREAAP
jgi:HPt (histidine-containing phosphotransfer) domain-containing protein/HAMP domain-containing protein